MIGELIERGHAYPGIDGNGDVYFDVHSWPSYGELSRQKLSDMEPAADAVSNAGKKDPRDFALWKGHKPDEPTTASWPSPWGRGRPGWHIECSAMAGKYLGDAFDIHGGGIDLRFPHHENELAQSKASGRGFAQFWMHNLWVTASGEKMSKSLDNGMAVSEVVKRVPPIAVRYYLAQPHYRSHVEFSFEALDEAAAAFARIQSFLTRAVERVGPVKPALDLPDEFTVAMDDDLATPAAVAVVHDAVRAGNTALDARDDAAVAESAATIRAMLDVLGLDPFAEPWAGVICRQRRADRRRRRAGPRDARPARGRAGAARLRRRRPGAGPTERPRRHRRGHPVRTPLGPGRPEGARLMAGNSSRKGAIRAKSGGNPAVGSGGRRRKGLEGRGPTPKATDRPNHKAHKRASSASRVAPGDRARQAGPRRSRDQGGPDWVAGRNPVVEALRAGVPVTTLFVAEHIERDDRVREIFQIAIDRKVPMLEAPRSEIDRLVGGVSHQGVALQVPEYRYAHPDDLLAAADERRPAGADRRAGRRHRPAEPGCDRPVRRRLRCPRRRRAGAAGRRHDGERAEGRRRGRFADPGGQGDQPRPCAQGLRGRRTPDHRARRRRRADDR